MAAIMRRAHCPCQTAKASGRPTILDEEAGESALLGITQNEKRGMMYPVARARKRSPIFVARLFQELGSLVPR